MKMAANRPAQKYSPDLIRTIIVYTVCKTKWIAWLCWKLNYFRLSQIKRTKFRIQGTRAFLFAWEWNCYWWWWWPQKELVKLKHESDKTCFKRYSVLPGLCWADLFHLHLQLKILLIVISNDIVGGKHYCIFWSKTHQI